jgi:LmbE family N-acetylglucosaminyl deacetylase
VREVWISGGPAPTHYVDITETFARKLAALRSHVSQVKDIDGLEEMLRSRLGRAAVQGGLPDGSLAEAFQVLQSG